MNLEQIKKEQSAEKYVSIFGKSTLDSNSKEYNFVEEITEYLIRENHAVIHGGYAGGVMQAVADTAHRLILELGLPQERNIAVPQIQHDGAGWARVDNAHFLQPAGNIYDRLKNVASYSDIAIVAPKGGDGTLLELATVWHENVIAKHTGDSITPLIILSTDDGTDWHKILETFVRELDTSNDSLDELNWLYFVSDFEDFKLLFNSLK